MQGEYDAIVVGTGMVECVLAGILAVEGRRILVLDRNPYYGGDGASLQIQQLYKEFGKGPVPEHFTKRGAQFNVDLAPKLLMGTGSLTKILSKSVAGRYNMQFMVIQGSYLVHKGKIQKVPITPSEAMSSSLMGIFQKRHCGSFLKFVADYEKDDQKTWDKKDLRRMTFHALTDSFGLDANAEGFIGTAVALEIDNGFLARPALPTVEKLQLYLDSQLTYKDSPYVYPVYGLGDIPQGFARLCAVFNGVFMLQRPDTEVLYDAEGRFAGVRSEGEIARAPIVIGDPSYFPTKTVKTGEVVRAIALLDRPIEGIAKGSHSCQIILPAKETGRKTDMYIVMLCSVHQVCPAGLYIAIVSATMESDDEKANLAPGLALLPQPIELFVKRYPQYRPDPSKNVAGDGCFIGESLDATSHFEAEAATISRLYERITGRPFDVDKWELPSEEDLMRRQMEAMEAARADAEKAKAAAESGGGSAADGGGAAAAAAAAAPAAEAAAADPSAAPAAETS